MNYELYIYLNIYIYMWLHAVTLETCLSGPYSGGRLSSRVAEKTRKFSTAKFRPKRYNMLMSFQVWLWLLARLPLTSSRLVGYHSTPLWYNTPIETKEFNIGAWVSYPTLPRHNVPGSNLMLNSNPKLGYNVTRSVMGGYFGQYLQQKVFLSQLD